MKKKKIPKPAIIAGIVVLLVVIAVVAMQLLRVYRMETLVQQQNYVASRLIEMGDYEQARILAAQNDQVKENNISKELLVLATGFQSDYKTAMQYADRYLEKGNDEVLESAKTVMVQFLTEEALLDSKDYTYTELCENLKSNVRDGLLRLLLDVQGNIRVRRNSEDIQAMLDMMSTQGMGLNSQTLETLANDNSTLSQKLKTAYAIQTGDYTKAFELAEDMFEENDSFENRAMLANLIAKYGNYIQSDDTTLTDLRSTQQELSSQLGNLQSQYAQATSESDQRRLNRQIENVQASIEDINDAIQAEPVRRAINFIETTTPVSERNTVAYKLELAQLYYQASDRERAKEYLVEVIKDEDDGSEPATLLLNDFIQFYQIMNGQESRPAYLDSQTMNVGVIWNRIAQLLNFIESGYYYEESESFYGYVLSVLDELYNGVIIRNIDATDFPVVRVTVNVAMELEEELKKSNFSITEMNSRINDFEILNMEDLELDGDMSVVLVVDRSGSMDGTRMDDTKKAVSNFIRNVNDNIRVGLVTFAGSAGVDCPISDSRNPVLQAMQAVNASGGTSIYSGLQVAGTQLDGESGQKIIILLSDGEDGDASRIDEVLDELSRKNIYVYTIGFGGADTEYLSYIASKTRGKFIQADSSGTLGEIYSAIGEYMVNDYVLQFEIVVDPENFTRIVNISVDVNDAFAEQEYSVGVSYDDILGEQNETPLADYFRQIGGSWMNSEGE